MHIYIYIYINNQVCEGGMQISNVYIYIYIPIPTIARIARIAPGMRWGGWLGVSGTGVREMALINKERVESMTPSYLN